MFINKFVFRSLVAFLLLSISLNVQSQELNRLVESQPSQALKQLDALLKEDSENVQALFLKGVALENLGNTSEAITVYKNTISQFPKQPEAYLNLANIYNNQGNYKQAKKLLEKSFTQHPVYSKAYYGMQKIHSHLAAEAYQEALNKKAVISEPKLARVTSLKLTGKNAPAALSAPTPAVTAEMTSLLENLIEPSTPVEEKPKPEVVTKPVVKPIIKPAAKPIPVKPEIDVVDNVKGWASAWSAQNVTEFVSYYSNDYKVDGKSRSQWVADRRIKLTNKKFIKVNVGSFKKKKLNSNTVQVDFVQSYRSNTIADTIRKRLVFKRFGKEWKIVGERVIR